MKTSFKIFLSIFSVMSLAGLLSACHSGQKDSSAVADSANKAQIAATDSAAKAQKVNTDSANKAKTTLEKDASTFLVKGYEAGMFEIQLSQLAMTNGLDADVKNLAKSLIPAHTAINAKMGAIAAGASFVLPTAIDADHQKALNDMAKLTGADFDKKYINTIVSGHEDAVKDFKDAYKNLAPGDTKTFAGETLPKIEDHLAMAKKVKDRIK